VEAMRAKVLGKRWILRFAPNQANLSDCDSPAQPGKEIRISSALECEE
jgi:hypothetical protein